MTDHSVSAAARRGRALSAAADPAIRRHRQAARLLLPHLERGRRIDAADPARRDGKRLRRLRRRRRLGLEDRL